MTAQSHPEIAQWPEGVLEVTICFKDFMRFFADLPAPSAAAGLDQPAGAAAALNSALSANPILLRVGGLGVAASISPDLHRMVERLERSQRAGLDDAPREDLRRYRCILADPPWTYRNGGNGAARNHYPTMSTDALKAMPVSRMAADDCVLIMWATWPMLPDALALIEAWDFTYVTGLPWVKLSKTPNTDANGGSSPRPSYGTGAWLRGCSEPILIAKRGNARPATGNYLGLLSERLSHSRKPDSIYELAEGLVPLAPPLEPPRHLEMFARRRRPGWDVFGHIEGSISLPIGD